jgi:threonine/homoserine/homoserine lactone efflux protein
MRIVRLLSRVAFICNICFLLASFIQWLPHPPEGALISLIIVLGWLLSILVNFIVNGWVIGLLVAGKLRAASIPRWLLIVNGLFFIIQLALLILNRT